MSPCCSKNVNKLPEKFTFSVDYAVKSLEWPAAKKKLGHSGHREYKLTDKPFQVYLRCRCNGDVVFRLASRLCDLIQRCNLTNSLQFVKDWTETRARARRPTSTDPLTRLRNDTKKLLNARAWKSFRRFMSEREDLESDKKASWGPCGGMRPKLELAPSHVGSLIKICRSPTCHNRLRVLRNQRGNVAVTNCSGFPRQTGFFPIAKHHQHNILLSEENWGSKTWVMIVSCLQMHPTLTDPAALQVPAALVALRNRALL